MRCFYTKADAAPATVNKSRIAEYATAHLVWEGCNLGRKPLISPETGQKDHRDSGGLFTQWSEPDSALFRILVFPLSLF